MEIPAYHKLLTIGDVAVIPYPDFAQKTAIAKYLIQTAKKLEIDVPKVACIAPSEQLLPSVQSSVEATLLAKMGERGQLGTKVYIDGPLALDVAIVFFKSCTKFGGAELAAMVMGAKVPCVLTSRGDSKKTKMYSIALACLSAK